MRILLFNQHALHYLAIINFLFRFKTQNNQVAENLFLTFTLFPSAKKTVIIKKLFLHEEGILLWTLSLSFWILLQNSIRIFWIKYYPSFPPLRMAALAGLFYLLFFFAFLNIEKRA